MIIIALILAVWWQKQAFMLLASKNIIPMVVAINIQRTPYVELRTLSFRTNFLHFQIFDTK